MTGVSPVVGGYVMLGGILFLFAAGIRARWQRRASRDPRDFVRTTTVDDVPATVLRGRITLRPAALIIASFAVFVLWWGSVATEGMGSRLAMVPFLLLAGWLAGVCLLVVTGRIRYRHTVLTRDGITQSDAGLVQHVRWNDVRSVTVVALGLDLNATHVDRHRTASALWTGRLRTRQTDGAMRLLLRDHHPRLAIAASVWMWINDRSLRAEIGTEAAVERLTSDDWLPSGEVPAPYELP